MPARTTAVAAFAILVMLINPRRVLADDAPAPAEPGYWLLNYGLRFGATVTNPTVADAEFVLTWMTAAGRVSPDLADAHQWRYDLLTRLDRSGEALAALRDYVAAAPEDLPARFDLLDREIAAVQTVEGRISTYNGWLDRADLPREVRSAVLQRLARLHYRQGDVDQARADAQAALNLMPLNLSAQTLLAEIDDRLDEPATRIRLLCVQLAINPASVTSRWQLADALAAFGASARAVRYYDFAIAAFERTYPQRTTPADLLLARAQAQLDAGDAQAAIASCRAVLAADPASVDAAMLLIRAARKTGELDLADAEAAKLDASLRELEPRAVADNNTRVLHQIAAFSLDVVSDPARALEFANQAVEQQPDDPLIRRDLGRAYLQTSNVEQAIKTLTPLADDDQIAALALARALRAQDKPAEAADVLRKAQRLRFAGPAHDRIVAVLRELHASPVDPPDSQAMSAALDAFDGRVLDFPSKAGELLDFEVALESAALPFAAPARARLALTNNAPYPVTLGPERMVNPQVAVSLAEAARPDARLAHYLTVGLPETFVLQPGTTIATTTRLDSFATWPILYYQPQRRVVTEFAFTLDPAAPAAEAARVSGADAARSPVPEGTEPAARADRLTLTSGDGDDATTNGAAPSTTEAADAAAEAGGAPLVASTLAGLAPVERTLVRLPVDASEKGLRQIAQRLQQGSESERLTAITTLLALIYEHQEYVQGRAHRYKATPVDDAALTALIREAMRDPTPVVRARAVGALTYLPLDGATIQAAAPLLSDGHWLPRMLAVELFAKKQGATFLPVLRRLADDPDPSVAQLAKLYRDQLAPPQSPRSGRP